MPLLTRLRNLWRRPALEREFDEELQFHLDMRLARNLGAGMPRGEAEAEARRHMGSTLRAREAMHEARIVPSVESIGRDVAHAVRALRRRPAFVSMAVLTIALGIGANTAIYSVLQAVWIDAVPFTDPARLIVVRQYQRSWPEFVELRDSSRSFSDLVPLQRLVALVRHGDQTTAVESVGTTDAIFPALGVAPMLGRPFMPADLTAGAAPVVLLSHAYWQERHGGDPVVIGRTLRLRRIGGEGGNRGDEIATIIGVMPPDARVLTWESSLWLPAPPEGRAPESRVDALVGRLHKGASTASAHDEMSAIVGRLDAQKPASRRPQPFRIVSLRDEVVGVGIGQSLFLLLGATAIVLLIACANVANLFLARGLEQNREMAVRAAIGAGRGRLIRQAFIENALVAAAGCAFGIAIAAAARDTLVAIMPHNLPRAEAIAIDWRVMLFSAALAAGTAILTGLVPSLRSSAGRPLAVLTSAGAQSTTAPRRRLAHTLVAAEVALSVVVLAAAGLLIGSFLKLTAIDPGFVADNVAAFRADPTSVTRPFSIDAALRVLDELSHAPDVVAAAVASKVPFVGGGFGRAVRVPGEPGDVMTTFHTISPDYFTVMRIGFRAGRDFARSDDADSTPVVIVNERAAQTLWPGRPAVGQRLDVHGMTGSAPAVVVGVVNDVRYSALDREPAIEVYAPVPQLGGNTTAQNFLVRTTGRPVQAIQRLTPRIEEITGNPVAGLTALDTYISRSVHLPRFRALLFGLMGVLVMLLTAIGVFSVTAQVVAQRRREIGIRMAIGAQARQVLRLMLRQTSAPVVAGTLLGLLGALATTSLIAQFLYATTPTDPQTLAMVACAVVTIAMIAAAVPARRALRTNPLDVLRLD